MRNLPRPALSVAAFKTRGIVLRHVDWRENDRMLTLLTPGMGRVGAVARGCRRRASPLLNASEVFAECEYVLVQTRDRLTVAGAELLRGAYGLRLDYDRLTHAAYILALCEAAAQPGEECRAMYALLRGGIAALETADLCVLRDVTTAFLARFADASGFRPMLDACAECGAPISDQSVFSIEAGGLVCRVCETRAREAWARDQKARPRAGLASASCMALFSVSSAQQAWLRAVLADGYTQTGASGSPPLAPLRAFVESRLDANLSRFSL